MCASLNKGTTTATAIVSRDPDRSGNFVCSGVADDLEIQAAVDYVENLGGGLILIKEGNFSITATVRVYRRIWLRGCGIQATTMTLAHDGTMFSMQQEAGDPISIGFVRISDMYMSGFSGTYPNGNAVVVQNFSDCIIDHNFITGFGIYGIHLNSGYYHHIPDNWVEGNGYGLYIEDGVGDNFITNNTFSLSTEDNIFDSGNDQRIIGNTINTAEKNGYSNRGGTGSPYTLLMGNTFRDNGKDAVNTYYHIDATGGYIRILGNIFILCDDLVYTIRVWDCTGGIIDNNVFVDVATTGHITVVGATTGLYIGTGNRFHVYGLIQDNGINTRFASKVFQFIQGTTFISADGSAKGWEINAEADMAIALGQLPSEVQQVVRIKIWAVALGVPGAGGQMLLDIVIQAGADNLAYTTENINLAAFESVTTDYVATDVVHWSMDATDDADIGDLVGGMSVECKINGAPVSAPDEATNATFRVIEIEYV